MLYTLKEQTQKNKTVAEAISAARFILEDRYNVKMVNITCLDKMNLIETDMITIQEMNKITDLIIKDSKYNRTN